MSGFLVNKSLLDPTVTQYAGGTATFTLPQSGSTNATEVYVGGVPQIAGVDFNVTGTTLTLTTSAPAGANFVCARQYFSDGITGTAGANTVATAAIQNDSVTGGKLNPALVAGDLIYADGTDTINRLAKGTALQTLQMNAGATAPNWVTASAGGLLQMVHVEISTEPSITVGTTYTDIAGLSLSITPASTSNKILVTFNAGIVGNSSNTVSFILERDIGGSTTLLGGHTSLTRQMAWVRYDSQSDGNHDNGATGIYYDTTHNTTAAITYKVQWMSQGTAYLNRSPTFENSTNSYAALPNTRFFAQEIGV
jgi:hypothetical protein